MPAIVVRKLSVAIHRRLRAQARLHGRSTEAEVREILAQAVQPPARGGLGAEIHQFAQRFGGLELEVKRDRRRAAAAEFR